MSKIQFAKTVAHHASSLSASWVISRIVKNVTAPDNLLQKAEVAVGSLVLGSMVGDYAGKYTDQKLDEIHAKYIEWSTPKPSK